MRRRIAFPILTTLGCLAFIVLGIEGIVRFVIDDGMQYDLEMWKYARDVKQLSIDPLMSHKHAPYRQARLMGVDFRTNSKGLRDREFAYSSPRAKLRVLMLGDSLTVGWGVRIEETFAKRVERMYLDKGIDAEVINTGVGNYNTIQEVEYFLTEGYKYKPNLIVLNYFINDAEPVPSYRRSIIPPMCDSCVFIAGAADTLLRKFLGEMDWAKYYLALYGDGKTKGWIDAKESIRKLTEYCKTNDVELLIVSLPELHDVRNYRFQQVTDFLHEAASEYGADFVDMLPYLRNQRSSDLWVTRADPHPNAFADKLIANGIFDALQKMHQKSVDRNANPEP